MEKSAKKKKGIIVSHTHWDREWRYPIWETRLMLVEFFEQLIKVLESGDYPAFLLDGQVSVVLDFLEIRPGMKERVVKLVKAGKLQIGPWFILPDEYPVDGEALIRNLLIGLRTADQLGGAFRVGYTSFGWGQTAQLPQIYSQFGFDVAMIGKRVSKERAPQCEFVWQAPDGSELTATRFGAIGRQNFFLQMHLSALFGVDHFSDGWVYDWEKGGIAYHRADNEMMEQDHFRLDSLKTWHPEYITPQAIEAVWKTMDESILSDQRLMMNGCDYSMAQPKVNSMIKKINEIDLDPERQWVHGTILDYVKLLAGLDRSKLKKVTGELRDGPASELTGNALSTRLYLKQLNKKAQNLLIRMAEPISILSFMSGDNYEQEIIEKAWLYLLESHPHDSINGVTQDKTSDDTQGRLSQVIEISNTLIDRAMKSLIRRMDLSSFDSKDVLLTVFNSMPYARKCVLEAWVNMPHEKERFEYFIEKPCGIEVVDAAGQNLSVQWQGFTEERYCVSMLESRAFPYLCRRHRLFFETPEIPAGGYCTVKVKEIESSIEIQDVQWNNSVARTSTLLTAPNVMQNEYLKIKMNCNGTFDMTDKRDGRIFEGLNYYEDRGENGNYWINKRPMFDEIHISLGCTAKIWAQEAGPLQATLTSEVTMEIPNKGNVAKSKRSEERSDLVIRTSVTLRRGQEFAEVKVEFDNRHKNHYLRVMLPTGIANAMHADAGGHFTVDRRPIRPQGPNAGAIWPDMGTLPQNGFIDINDGERGFAVLNEGLMEYEVLENDERTLALSLLRSVKNWICTEIRVGSVFPSQDGGQCLGRHTIRYAIMPHSGDWKVANVPLKADLFNVPVLPVQTNAHAGDLPGTNSMFEISNTAVRFAALKKAQDRDSIILRMYNPTDETQETVVAFGFGVSQAWLTNLDEHHISEIEVFDKKRVKIKIDPMRIVTIEFVK